MKKIFITLGAVLAFGIASAQTDPKQPQQPQAPPETPKADIKPKSLEDAEIQNDAVSNNPKKPGEVQPRKDELKTQGHVKSTLHTEGVQDTVRPVKKAKKKRQ
ncbi:MAG TPA: hypothetical protein VEA37_01450 [Flavobacterium sp.]|nr:hypothetical protein [Flavobacterium sp.]